MTLVTSSESKRFAVMFGVILIMACAPTFSTAEDHIVEMQGLEFSPAELVIAPGDTVTWVNSDVLDHTTTSSDGGWDSGSMGAGDEWSFTFDDAGSFDYDCTFHPTMIGVIIVE